MTDPEKLRLLAALQDKQDADRGMYDRTEVQDDLRRIADWIEARANPNILAAARSRYSEAVRFTFTQKQWDEIMEETRQIVAAALTPPGDTDE